MCLPGMEGELGEVEGGKQEVGSGEGVADVVAGWV